jgi:hypothetical protein
MRQHDVLTKRTPRRGMLAILVGGIASLTGLPTAAAAKNVSGDRAMPLAASLDNVSQVFQQLIAILQFQGPDAARRYASDQGILTTQDEVRVTLVLDTSDQYVVDQAAIAVGQLDARVTATFEDTIEIVVPVQTIADAVTRAVQSNSSELPFFQPLADIAHIRSIRRTPIASPARPILPGS